MSGGSISIPEVLWRCMQEFFQNLSWDNFVSDMENRPVPFTLIHGDFHPGNILWVPDDSDFPVRMLDWEMAGVGRASQDLGKYVIGVLDHSKYGRDYHENLLRLYHNELMNANPSIKDFPFEVCLNDFLIGGMRMWLQLLPLLAKLIPDAMEFMVNRLELFRAIHDLQPEMLNYPSQQGKL